MNLLYDGTINCFSTLAQASIASNETFTYKQAICQKDYIEFAKAMVKEVYDHELRDYWTLILCQDMPIDAKPLWLSGHSNASVFRMGP